MVLVAIQRHLLPVPYLPSIALLALTALVACAHGRPIYDYSHEPDPRHSEFVVGPADVLRVNVWKDQELSTDATVRPDGTVTLPLVGDIPAAGHTPSQIRQEIVDRLGKYLKSDAVTVTVAILTVNSYKFTVSGNVEKPGLFGSPSYLTVSEAVALAGGPNRYANLSQAVLVRKDGRRTKVIPIDLESLLAGRYPEQNVVVLAGDTLYVP